MSKAEELGAVARDLASKLFGKDLPCRDCREGGCLRREEARPLTPVERKLGWTQRPFDAYNPLSMCLACAAYWYAELCAQNLHKLYCIETKYPTTKKEG